jgi:hypothetical protein
MKLSDRITNEEAHPWVIEEIKKLEEIIEAHPWVEFRSDHPLNSRRFFIATKISKNTWVGGAEFPSIESVRTRIRQLKTNKNLDGDEFLPLEIVTTYHKADEKVS